MVMEEGSKASSFSLIVGLVFLIHSTYSFIYTLYEDSSLIYLV